MASAVRRLGSLSMARGCARIDAGPDTAKIGSADRVQVHHARLIAVIGVRKTYPHGLDPIADMVVAGQCLLLGVDRTCRSTLVTSGFHPLRKSGRRDPVAGLVVSSLK